MDHPESRTRARMMVAGIAWNAAGRGLPLLLALLLTPILVHQLGLDRWGLFTLALAMVGVFGVFDLGVGQALTRALSERIGAGREAEAAGLVGAALAVLAGISLVMALALWLGIPWLVEHGLQVPPALQPQAVSGMRVLALAAPLVVLNAALWGVLAAYQRFRAANLVTIPVNLFYYLGPVLVLLVWDSLTAVMLALVGVRLVNTLSYLLLLRRLVAQVLATPLRLGLVLPLLRIGGWMTFSGLLTQALLYADRFLIGALLSLTAVAYYATPLDLVMRVWMLPVAVAQTLLPAFASAHATLPRQTASLLRRGGLMVMGLVLPVGLLLAGGGEFILVLWLGPDFAAGGGQVLRILGAGIFFSCLAFVPAALIDAIGRPDVTARFALLQALLYLPLAALLLRWIGIEGAAIAWALRCLVDALGKLWLAGRLYPAVRRAVATLLPPLAAAGCCLALLPVLPRATAAPLLALAGLAGFGLLALRALEPAEKARLRGLLRLPGGALRAGSGS
ncbi:oligosaccharide flippase family protein [Roseicella frigidaeris]|uniref:Flippase n=1 Tax=Roseicella frigidaeris TaxID=2230885 RepID=A0A327MBI8_9PROT|nr:oligosaccharide flippase family protein [Roseicella frigidaeris]RAI60310.1 flippase [Roseicella frigidaeris]